MGSWEEIRNMSRRQTEARLASLDSELARLQAENYFLKGQVAGLTRSMGELNERWRKDTEELRRLRWVIADRLDGEEYDDLQK